MDFIPWDNEERRNVNKSLLLAVEQYKNFLDSKNMFNKVNEMEITLSSLVNNVLYPENVRNRGKIDTYEYPADPGGPIRCSIVIRAGPRRGRCQNRLYRGVRMYCNKEIHKKRRCQYHWRLFRQKHHL